MYSHRVLHLGLLHNDSDFGQAVSYIVGPIGISECPKTLRNGFIHAVSRKLESVLDALTSLQVTRHIRSATRGKYQIRYFFAIQDLRAGRRRWLKGDFATLRGRD